MSDLQDKINGRIETLRKSIDQKYEKANRLEKESDYDGEGEMDDKFKKRTSLMTIANRQMDRIHELCRLSDKHDFGDHKLENPELNGGP